jgi:hypothetical protein
MGLPHPQGESTPTSNIPYPCRSEGLPHRVYERACRSNTGCLNEWYGVPIPDIAGTRTRYSQYLYGIYSLLAPAILVACPGNTDSLCGYGRVPLRIILPAPTSHRKWGIYQNYSLNLLINLLTEKA